MADSERVFIYHHTHVTNLPGIIENGILCKSLAKDMKVDASLDSIQQRRKRKLVTCGPGSLLHDYTPFYFGYRSPMMLKISSGEVPNYKGTQEEMVYLVTDVQSIVSEDIPYVFTDGHPIVFPSKFYTDLTDLSQVDWEVIKGKWWNDTPRFPDRQRRRQAEFLVYRCCPWNVIRYIGVNNNKVSAEVENLLKPFAHKPQVLLRRNWYY